MVLLLFRVVSVGVERSSHAEACHWPCIDEQPSCTTGGKIYPKQVLLPWAFAGTRVTRREATLSAMAFMLLVSGP